MGGNGGDGKARGGEEVATVHGQFAEAIDLAADGDRTGPAWRELEAHLSGCAGCQGALERAERVVERLAGGRIEVRHGFAREVMAALEPAPWEARAPRAWKLPLALLLAVGTASAVLFGVGAAELEPTGGSLGALIALLDLLRAGLVAGSGLATASFRGVGDAVGSWLGDSTANWIAAAILAGGANYLLFRLVRLRRPAAEGIERSSRR